MGELVSIQQECDLAPSRVLNDYTINMGTIRIHCNRNSSRIQLSFSNSFLHPNFSTVNFLVLT